MKEQMLKEIEGVAWYTAPHGLIKTFGIDKNGIRYNLRKENISDIISKTREETIRELIEMCVDFDEYHNDQIISKEMLQGELNKLKK